MWITYCREDLPSQVVVAWAPKQQAAMDVKCGNHDDLDPTPEEPSDWESDSSQFELTDIEWDAVSVEGNPSQTAANIVANHSAKFV